MDKNKKEKTEITKKASIDDIKKPKLKAKQGKN